MELAMGGGEATGAGEVKWGAAVVGYDIHTSGGKQHAVYIIDITVSTEHIVIARRYSAFKRLRDELVHMFPRVGVPVLPQSGSFRSLDNTYLSKKQLALHEWLAEVVAIPQLAKSNTLLEFLKDDESEKTLDPCRTAVGLLIQPMDMQEVAVKSGSSFTKRFTVPSVGHVAIWEFETKANDIAFFVKFNDEVVVEHARYRSHEAIVQGSYTATAVGVCELVWDNAYSRMRTKALRYRAMVVDADAAAAGAAAEEAAKAKIRSRRSLAELLRPRTVRSKVAQVDEGMVARAHRDQALSELQEAAEQRAELERQIKDLKGELANAQLKFEGEHHQRRVVADELSQVKAQLSTTSEQLATALAEHKGASVAKTQLEDAARATAIEIEELRKARDDALLRAQVTRESISKAMQARDEAQSSAKAARSEAAELRQRLEVATDATRVAAMEAKVKELEARTVAAEADAAKAKSVAAQVIKASRVLEEKVTKLRGQKKLLVNEIKSARAALAAAEQATAEAQAAAKAATDQAAALAAAAPAAAAPSPQPQSAAAGSPTGAAVDASDARSVRSGRSATGSRRHRLGSGSSHASGARTALSSSPHTVRGTRTLAGTHVPPSPTRSVTTSSVQSHRSVTGSIGARIAAMMSGSPNPPPRPAANAALDGIVRVRSWSGDGNGGAAPGSAEPTPTPRPQPQRQGIAADGQSVPVAMGARDRPLDGHRSVAASHSRRAVGAPPPSPGRSVTNDSLGTSLGSFGTSPASSSRSMRSAGGHPSAHASMAAMMGSALPAPVGGPPPPQVPLHRHRFWRFEPLFAGGDPSKMAPTDLQVWSFPVLHTPRSVDPRNTIAMKQPRGNAAREGPPQFTQTPTRQSSRRRASLMAPGSAALAAAARTPSPGDLSSARRRRSDFGLTTVGHASVSGVVTAIMFTSQPEAPELQGTEDQRMRMVFGPPPGAQQRVAGSGGSGGSSGGNGSLAAAMWSPGSARSRGTVNSVASPGQRGAARGAATAGGSGRAGAVAPGSAKKKSGLWDSITKGVMGLVDDLDITAANRKKYPRFNVLCVSCGTAPLRCVHWRCSVDRNVVLCDRCYRYGAHGFEQAPGSFYQRRQQQQALLQRQRQAEQEAASADGGAGEVGAEAEPRGATAQGPGTYPASDHDRDSRDGIGDQEHADASERLPHRGSPRSPARGRSNSLLAVTAIT